MNAPDRIDAARIDLALGELRLPGIKLIWTALAATADHSDPGRIASARIDLLPGRHVTDRQMRLFMNMRRNHSPAISAAKRNVSTTLRQPVSEFKLECHPSISAFGLAG